MWHKAEWMGRPMRLELTRVGLLVQLANRYTTRGAPKKYIIDNISYYTVICDVILCWTQVMLGSLSSLLINFMH